MSEEGLDIFNELEKALDVPMVTVKDGVTSKMCSVHYACPGGSVCQIGVAGPGRTYRSTYASQIVDKSVYTGIERNALEAGFAVETLGSCRKAVLA